MLLLFSKLSVVSRQVIYNCKVKYITSIRVEPGGPWNFRKPTLTPANVLLSSTLLVNGTCYRIALKLQHLFPRSKETIWRWPSPISKKSDFDSYMMSIISHCYAEAPLLYSLIDQLLYYLYYVYKWIYIFLLAWFFILY